MYRGATYTEKIVENLEETLRKNKKLSFPIDLVFAKVHTGVLMTTNDTAEFINRWPADSQLIVAEIDDGVLTPEQQQIKEHRETYTEQQNWPTHDVAGVHRGNQTRCYARHRVLFSSVLCLLISTPRVLCFATALSFLSLKLRNQHPRPEAETKLLQ